MVALGVVGQECQQVPSHRKVALSLEKRYPEGSTEQPLKLSSEKKVPRGTQLRKCVGTSSLPPRFPLELQSMGPSRALRSPALRKPAHLCSARLPRRTCPQNVDSAP